MQSRPPIPAAVKREIRRRCGFGCVMCGCPVFDYEHIEGIGVTGNDPSHMTLLCPGHHRDKTAGRLPVSLVKSSDAEPFNRGRAYSSGHPLYFDRSLPLTLQLGNVALEVNKAHDLIGIAVDRDWALSIGFTADGHPVVSMDLRNPDDRGLLRVVNGQLRVSPHNWDVDFVGTRLQLRSAPRKRVIDVRFIADESLIKVDAADFYLHQTNIQVGKYAPNGGFELPQTNNWVADLTISGSGGIAVGERPLTDGSFFLFAKRAASAFSRHAPALCDQ